MDFTMIGDDLTLIILSKLPARAFAYSACVNISWNKLCSKILSQPKFASALSLNPCILDAVNEVVDKVLAEPIRPDFVIASIGKHFGLELTHYILTRCFGTSIPIVTNIAKGIVGSDAVSGIMNEKEWEVDEDNDLQHHDECEPKRGIVLMIGYLPGIKVGLVPLLKPRTLLEPEVVRAFSTSAVHSDQFLRDIKSFSLAVSGAEDPSCFILFGDNNTDMKPIISKMDRELPEQTIIIGDASCSFTSSWADNNQSNLEANYVVEALAFIFANDRNKPEGIGEIKFNVAISTGLMEFGPKLQTFGLVIKGSECSWFTAIAEGEENLFDFQGFLERTQAEIQPDEDFDDSQLYIGVFRRREPPIRSGPSLTYYEICAFENTLVVVNGAGIMPGDTFKFFLSDRDTAAALFNDSYHTFAHFNEQAAKGRNLPESSSGSSSSRGWQSRGVFGGMIFSCCIHDDDFSSMTPFRVNFRGVPVGGVFCRRQVGRASGSGLMGEHDDENEDNSPHCCMLYNSSVYLVLSYTPESP